MNNYPTNSSKNNFAKKIISALFKRPLQSKPDHDTKRSDLQIVATEDFSVSSLADESVTPVRKDKTNEMNLNEDALLEDMSELSLPSKMPSNMSSNLSLHKEISQSSPLEYDIMSSEQLQLSPNTADYLPKNAVTDKIMMQRFMNTLPYDIATRNDASSVVSELTSQSKYSERERGRPSSARSI